MTLTVTVLSREVIYQSADFRLTGQHDSHSSPKITQLHFSWFLGIVTYSGLGSYNYKDVSSLIAEWLTGVPDLSIGEAAELLQARGTQLVAEVRRDGGGLWPMTFVLAGFEDNRPPIVYIASNCENIRREQYPLSRH